MNLADREDRTVACGEYVLGTLPVTDRAAFLARLSTDRELQDEVAFWQDRLLGLARRVRPQSPSAALWQGIEARLGGETQPAGAAAAPAGIGPSPVRAATSRRPAPPLWERLGFWQTFSGLGLAASLLLAFMLVARAPSPSPASYVAVLQSSDQRAGWIVQASVGGPVKLVPLADLGTIPAGKSWQLWTKGKSASAPTSLGLVPGADALEVPRERLPYLGEEQLFEITLEPPDGSPTGRPTGPVLFLGKAQRI